VEPMPIAKPMEEAQFASVAQVGLSFFCKNQFDAENIVKSHNGLKSDIIAHVCDLFSCF
jgi:hypothetical protein